MATWLRSMRIAEACWYRLSWRRSERAQRSRCWIHPILRSDWRASYRQFARVPFWHWKRRARFRRSSPTSSVPMGALRPFPSRPPWSRGTRIRPATRWVNCPIPAWGWTTLRTSRSPQAAPERPRASWACMGRFPISCAGTPGRSDSPAPTGSRCSPVWPTTRCYGTCSPRSPWGKRSRPGRPSRPGPSSPLDVEAEDLRRSPHA